MCPFVYAIIQITIDIPDLLFYFSLVKHQHKIRVIMLLSKYKKKYFDRTHLSTAQWIIPFLIAAFLFSYPSSVICSDITWKLFIRSSMNSGPVLTATTRESVSFIVDTSVITGSAAGSEDILEALDGSSFLIRQNPVSDPLTIHLILNTRGNTFESILGVSLCFNLDIEAYINGNKTDDRLFFQRSPLIMTIPAGNGLRYLTTMSNCSRTDLIFGYYQGGKFEKEGVETYSQVQGMVVNISILSTIVGGKNSDLGFSSSTTYDTWYKIKKLFE